MTIQLRPALRDTLRAGYGRADLLADLGAGLLVGVVALPLAMAFAIASGCTPAQGIITGIIAGIVVGCLGGSRVQIAGPTGAFVGICAGGVAQFGFAGLALATLVAGILLILMGLCRLGKAIEFIPIPVIIGFTSGIAVVIASTQCKEMLGLHFHDPGTLIGRMHSLWMHLHEFQVHALLLTLMTIGLIVVSKWISPRLPGALLAIIVLTLMTWALHLQDINTIQSVYGPISASIPWPSVANAGLGDHMSLVDLGGRLYQLRWLIISITLLGAIESLLSAVVADGMTGYRHDSDTELVAQGVANLATPWFLGLPVTGAIARTATNVRAGARSPVSSLVHAATLLLIVVAAAPLASHIPLACLSGVLLVVCWNMAEVHHWPSILRGRHADSFLLPLAFLLTVFVDLTMAVVVGTLLAMLVFVKRMAGTTTIERSLAPAHGLPEDGIPAGIEVFAVSGPFFFAAASMIRRLLSRIGMAPRVLILHFHQVPFIDATAAFALRDLQGECSRCGTVLLLSGVTDHPLAILAWTGVAEVIGTDNMLDTVEQAVSRARTLLADPIPAMRS